MYTLISHVPAGLFPSPTASYNCTHCPMSPATALFNRLLPCDQPINNNKSSNITLLFNWVKVPETVCARQVLDYWTISQAIFHFLFLEIGSSSVASPGWSQTQKSTCFYLLSAGSKGLHHHVWSTFCLFRWLFFTSIALAGQNLLCRTDLSQTYRDVSASSSCVLDYLFVCLAAGISLKCPGWFWTYSVT